MPQKPKAMSTSEPNVYAQDNWRMTSKLTLTYGVRYGVFTPYTEAHNGIDSFDPTTATLLVAGKNGEAQRLVERDRLTGLLQPFRDRPLRDGDAHLGHHDLGAGSGCHVVPP